MSDKTIFSKIIDQEIPGHFVYTDDVCIVIMDAFPSTPGQVLIIPREPADYVFDLDEATYNHILRVAKRVAKVLDQVYETSRTCVVVEGFQVPHVHIILYPLPADAEALKDYTAHITTADQEELATNCRKIKEQM